MPSPTTRRTRERQDLVAVRKPPETVAIGDRKIFGLQRVAAEKDLGAAPVPGPHRRPDARILDTVVAAREAHGIVTGPELAADGQELRRALVTLVVIEKIAVVAELGPGMWPHTMFTVIGPGRSVEAVLIC